jgi:hypothetical protein
MRAGMRGVLFWERWLFYRLMLGMRQWLGNRMVPGIFELAIPVLSGSCLDLDVYISHVFWRGLSW